MEKVEQTDLTEEQSELLSEAEKITAEVLNRMKESSKKYGTAYTLADIESEFDAELLDIVGWPLLEAVRIRQVMKNKLAKLNDDYLKKFLSYHDIDYLNKLRSAIDGELRNRSANSTNEIC